MFDFITNFLKNLELNNKPTAPNFHPDVVEKLLKPALIPLEAFKDSKAWKGVVIHHSATVDGRLNDWAAIRKYHMSYRIDGNIVGEQEFIARQMSGLGHTFEKPWKDIAYHLGLEIELDELVFRAGRPLSMIGAHAGIVGNNTFNENYIGLCVVGNYDALPPALQTLDVCATMIKELMARYNFGKDKVLGHREIYPILKVPVAKSCPGDKFLMNNLRDLL